jgi:hypothetical protein
MPKTLHPALELHEVQDLLGRTPSMLVALLGSLRPSWSHAKPATDAWAPFDVLCHLAYIEEHDWMARLKRILEHGATKPFDPVDHGLQTERFEGQGVDEVLTRFATCRANNLAELDELDLRTADLSRLGLHPSLGTVTLENLLAAWVVHDLNHVSQMTSGLAHRYKVQVGPWEEYLGILQRDP